MPHGAVRTPGRPDRAFRALGWSRPGGSVCESPSLPPRLTDSIVDVRTRMFLSQALLPLEGHCSTGATDRPVAVVRRVGATEGPICRRPEAFTAPRRRGP